MTPASEPISQSVIASSSSAAAPRILLAEDYEPNALAATILLQKSGYAVDRARDGEEAVEKFKGAHYDAVLLDVQMPRLDGLEAARLIRAFEKERGLARAPIIAMTANAGADDALFCSRAGIDDCLQKPFDGAAMAVKIEFLRSQNPPPPP